MRLLKLLKIFSWVKIQEKWWSKSRKRIFKLNCDYDQIFNCLIKIIMWWLRSFFAELFLMLRIRILSIPNSSIVISRGWNHSYSINCFKVKSWIQFHYLVKKKLLSQILFSYFIHSLFSWDSPLIMNWVRNISVIVCLNQIPSCIC